MPRCSVPLRSDDFERREVRAVARRIAREQDQTRDRCVGADVEVGEGRSSPAAPAAIAHEALPGEEGRLPGQGKSQEVLLGESVLELLDPLEPDRDLGVDERVDRERGSLGALREGLTRPRGPLRVLGKDVEQDVAIDEDSQ